MCESIGVPEVFWPSVRVMNFYVSPHDAAIAAERQCPHCKGSGRRLGFVVSGMRVIVPCECPLGEAETTICEVGNPYVRKVHDPSQHRRPSNILGRPKTAAAYWSRVRSLREVLDELEY
jgi:hypothetical protein